MYGQLIADAIADGTPGALDACVSSIVREQGTATWPEFDERSPRLYVRAMAEGLSDALDHRGGTVSREAIAFIAERIVEFARGEAERQRHARTT